MVIMVGSRQKKKKNQPENRKETGSGLKEVGLEAQGLLLKVLSTKPGWLNFHNHSRHFQVFY